MKNKGSAIKVNNIVTGVYHNLDENKTIIELSQDLVNIFGTIHHKILLEKVLKSVE